ncbi:MFS transporter [Bacillus thuringiensis]|uniref:MFS transporter n=1 Tax=Bacillus thuringiensis TaxID=1428 RepID=UPI002FFDD146
MNSNRRNFILAYSATMIGSQMFDFVVKWWIVKETGSAQALGAIIGIPMIVISILTFVPGILTDIFNKKKIMIVTDLISAVACFGSFVILINHGFSLIVIAIASLFLGLIKSTYAVASKGIFKNIFENKDIPSMNRAQSLLKQIIKLISPVLANILILYIKPELFFLFNGISFLLSAIFTMSFNYSTKTDIKSKLTFSVFIEQLKQGITVIKENPLVINTLILVSIANIFVGGYDVFMPVVVIDHMNSNFGYSMILTTTAIGALAAPFLLQFIESKKISIPLWFPVLLAMVAIIITSFSIVGSIIGGFILGLSVTMFDVEFSTLLQLNVEEQNIGKLFGVVFMIAGILTPVGNIVFPLILGSLGSYALLLIGSMGFFAVMITNLLTKPKGGI